MRCFSVVLAVLSSIVIVRQANAEDTLADISVKKELVNMEASDRWRREALLNVEEVWTKHRCFVLLDFLVEKEMMTERDADSLKLATSRDALTSMMIKKNHVSEEELEKVRTSDEERPMEAILVKKGFLSEKEIKETRERHGDAAVIALCEKLGLLRKENLEEVKAWIELDPVVRHLIFKGVVTKEEIEKAKKDGKKNPLVAVLIEKEKITEKEVWQKLVGKETKNEMGFDRMQGNLDDLAASAKGYINTSGKILWGFDIEEAVLSYLAELENPDQEN